MKNRDVIKYKKLWRPYYRIMEILLALDEIGIIEKLKRVDKISVSELAKDLNCDEVMLDAVLTYLWLNTSLIERTGKTYGFKKTELTKFFDNTLNGAGAYHPIFANLAGLLRKTLVYGKHVTRNGHKLQLVSKNFTESAVSAIIRKLADKKVQTAVDFGCGSGELLIRFCRSAPASIGIGIDIDPAAVEAARENVAKKGLKERITIVQSDICDTAKIKTAVEPAAEPLAFTAVGIIHELLRDGEEAVVELFKELRKACPESIFLIAEFNALSPEEIYNTDDERLHSLASYYQLIHPLSNQGNPQPMAIWQRIFSRCGLTIKAAEKLENNFVLYVLS